MTAAAMLRSIAPPFLALTTVAIGGAAEFAASSSHAQDAFAPVIGANRPGAPLPGMPADAGLDYELGRALFERIWVAAPASTRSADGLGPHFNARSCRDCHPGHGGGAPPALAGDAPRPGTVLKLSVPTDPITSEYGFFGPDPVLGAQLQDHALPGIPAEGRIEVSYREIPVALSGGEGASLRAPSYAIAGAAAPFAPDLMMSPRMAPPVLGLGLVAAIPDAAILAAADPDDRDGDGISGRINLVWSSAENAVWTGRFGWKAGFATLADQIADAFAHDIGISSPLYPAGWGDCTEAQADCRAAPDGGDPAAGGVEIGARALDLTVNHVAHVAPARVPQSAPAAAARGAAVFADAGCAACHLPEQTTGEVPGDPTLSGRVIHPYTDLLLHDMGAGLSDNRPEEGALGHEWRTAPLWGIGLTPPGGGHRFYLHDGRARSLLEAVLWHGGEAQASRDAVAALPPADRAALIRFLESL